MLNFTRANKVPNKKNPSQVPGGHVVVRGKALPCLDNEDLTGRKKRSKIDQFN